MKPGGRQLSPVSFRLAGSARRLQPERGNVIVEFAMIVPVLVVLLVTIIDLGVMIREHQLLQNAAREAARFSALPENRIDTSDDPDATEAEIKRRAVDYLAQENITITSGDVTVDQQRQIVIGGITVTGSEITVAYEREPLILGPPLLPADDFQLRTQAVFRNLY